MSQEIILTYSVNAERTRGWITMRGESERRIRETLEKSPLNPYLKYEIDELFIYDNPASLFPKTSLN